MLECVGPCCRIDALCPPILTQIRLLDCEVKENEGNDNGPPRWHGRRMPRARFPDP